MKKFIFPTFFLFFGLGSILLILERRLADYISDFQAGFLVGLGIVFVVFGTLYLGWCVVKKKNPVTFSNRFNLLFYVFAIVLFISSCSDENQLDGKWDDNIHLSSKSEEFTAKSDSVIITTKGDWWWVCSITVDGKDYYKFEGVDVTKEQYTIKEDCFVVERRDKNTLFIKLDDNPTKNDRKVNVCLEAGDYFDHIFVSQKGKE
ncbi:hypothetical protein EYV94_01920 [Puteibacter caeruleilacunae]|nr:hypothetical protein EYV94_01920 [Puteibacter caeruleilacunae]